MKASRPQSFNVRRAYPAIAAFFCTLMALPSALAANFPQYPLQSGNTQVAPNVLFILDDSESMNRREMPWDNGSMSDSGTVADDPLRSSYVHNTIYYNPNITYRPWLMANGQRMQSGTSATAVHSSLTMASGGPISLCSSSNKAPYFYVPKVEKPGTSVGDYIKYRLAPVSGNCTVQYYDGSKWVAGTPTITLANGTKTNRTQAEELANIATWYSYHRTRMKVAKAGASEAFSRLGNALRVGFATINTIDNDDALIPVGSHDGRFEDTTEASNRSDWFTKLFSRNTNGTTPLRVALNEAGQYFGRDDVAGPYGPQDNVYETRTETRTVDQQVCVRRNFRGECVDWDTQQVQEQVEVQVQTGTNQLQCRQNFAILTTDGYWNDNFSSNLIGDADGKQGERIVDDRLEATHPDFGKELVRYYPYALSNGGDGVDKSVAGERDTYNKYSAAYFKDKVITGGSLSGTTLADIAMYYWKTDLREDLDNIVPGSNANPAFWQHMVTFGVSIGLNGTLLQTSAAQVRADGGPKNSTGSVDWPNPINNSGAERIDDLLHAAVNGRGEFVVASNADEFAKKLSNVLGQIEASLASGSNVVTDSTSFQSNTHMYQATYMSQQWTGDLVQKNLTRNGIGTQNWSLAAQVRTDANFKNRPVMTFGATNGNNQGGVTFPSAAQRDVLGRTIGVNNATVSIGATENANYLKGDRSNEETFGGVLRNRNGLIGDIVNSSPYYVGDTDSVYVGANDGMLHGVDAGTGKALFSYVPKGVDMNALASFSDPSYQHRFFVDGPIAVSGHSLVADTNYLVGALGRGGRGVFALDVSTPRNFTAGDVLWDHTIVGSNTTTEPNMGFVTGVPLIVKAGNCGNSNCDPVAFVGNGLESPSNKAVLFAYNARTGEKLAEIEMPSMGTGPNGLSSPRAADLDFDPLDKSDYIYAGDLHGNVWKIDVRDSRPANWTVAYNGQPLFVAKMGTRRQPITGGLALAREPKAPDGTPGRVLVTFGTGRLVYEDDLSDKSIQTIYGIYDDGTLTTHGSPITARTQLTTREIAAWSADGTEIGYQDYSELPTGSRGWYIDLDLGNEPAPLDVYMGERVVGGAAINKRMLRIASVAPAAGIGCGANGRGHTHLIDAFTGTQPLEGNETGSFFDENRDGKGDTFTDAQGNVHKKGGEDAGVGMNTDSGQVDDLVLWCGSSGACVGINTTQGGGGGQRVGWREIYTR